jgi:hypothetical protein
MVEDAGPKPFDGRLRSNIVLADAYQEFTVVGGIARGQAVIPGGRVARNGWNWRSSRPSRAEG